MLGGLFLGAFVWAKSRLATRSTMTGQGVQPDNGIAVETLICFGLILLGILTIVFSASGSSSSSSSSSWGGGSSSSSSGGGGGGWSGGGASSSW